MKKEMRDKILSIIIFLTVIGIFSVLVVFVMIIVKDISNTNDLEAELMQTDVSTINNEKTVEDDIKAPEIVQNPINDIQSTTTASNDYSSVVVDKYFYNQLEEKSKIIYRAFESNKEQMKTGTYQIELGSNFSDILSQDNGQELLGDYYQSAIEAYTYDNADVFYLSPKKMYLNIETTTKGNRTTYNVYINSGNEDNYLTEEFNSREQINQAISQIEQVRDQILQNRTDDTYQDIKMIHDYLVDNINYDSTVSMPNIYNIYGALINKEAVCEGYARAFKYLLNEINIPCIMVIGTGTNSQGQTESHAWNYVQINQTWYAVDVTWDDPVVIGGGTVSEESRYRYFLVGENGIRSYCK